MAFSLLIITVIGTYSPLKQGKIRPVSKSVHVQTENSLLSFFSE